MPVKCKVLQTVVVPTYSRCTAGCLLQSFLYHCKIFNYRPDLLYLAIRTERGTAPSSSPQPNIQETLCRQQRGRDLAKLYPTPVTKVDHTFKGDLKYYWKVTYSYLTSRTQGNHSESPSISEKRNSTETRGSSIRLASFHKNSDVKYLQQVTFFYPSSRNI